MKTIKNALVILILLAMPSKCVCQTNLNFTSISVNPDGAVRIAWKSQTNEVYEIDYANELNTNDDGTTTWIKLYADYPSHGTNSFISDAGNYNLTPEVVHPKYAQTRFYRISLIGTNTANNPTVSIVSPANGSTVSGDVIVSLNANSTQLLTDTRVYVDGEEMWLSDDGTNFLINTCEWANGTHTIFAIARSQSALQGLPEDPAVRFGRAVSAYINVTFDNLITSFDFSQPFFEPDLGQTQVVSASFTSFVNWTLQIQNASSNSVRTVTGSGNSLTFDFDGTDGNGINLPFGKYTYLLSAQVTTGGSLSTSGPQSRSQEQTVDGISASVFTGHILTPSESEHLPPLPIGWKYGFAGNDSNQLQVVETPGLATHNFVTRPITRGLSAAASRLGVLPLVATSQQTSGPKKKPKEPHIGKTGTYGMLYCDFPNGISCNPPRTGFPTSPFFVKIDGNNTHFSASKTSAQIDAWNFDDAMRGSGYKKSFNKYGTQWRISDITGSGGLFNTVNLGILDTHGSWGDTTEKDFILHTYLWQEDGTYAHLTDFSLGSPGTNGLRWMTMLTCSTLRPANITSMANHGYLTQIITGDLHLLLGAENTLYTSGLVYSSYAQNLTAGQTIENAYFNALRSAIAKAAANGGAPPQAVKARILGWNPCFSDTLYSYYDPDTGQGIQSVSFQVYP